jgi:hypothetical protein
MKFALERAAKKDLAVAESLSICISLRDTMVGR